MLKMKITLLKFLKNEDLKIPVKIVKKMKTALCAGSPKYQTFQLDGKHNTV